jgi:pre-mRNA-splicing factor CWC26
MPADLAYLAKNYLTASNTTSSDYSGGGRPKKRRRKDKPESNNLIVDEDEDLSLSSTRRNGDVEDDEDAPTFDTGAKSAEFRKKKSSGWKTVTTDAAPQPSRQGEDVEADRIIAEAAEQSRQRREAFDDEDAPAVVDSVNVPQDDTPRMESGARAGLQTAADTAAFNLERRRKQDLEDRALSKSKKKSKHTDDAQQEEETIYRDATGRRIDISLKRAEARAAEQEKLRAERKAKEDAMGEVQLREKQERKKDLAEAKFLTLGRSADDEVMNEELKGVVRWDDPMAQYMAEKSAEERAAAAATRPRSGRDGGDSGVQKQRKKVYTGPPAAPNRYGILPGWRWDGVDRGNGFEKEWFQARSKKGRMEDLSYQWQMDE